MQSSLKGKTALVTGASGGLGTALCLWLGKQGANIVALDIDEKALQHLSATLDQRAIQYLALKTDLTDEDSCRNSVQKGEYSFGKTDLLIHCAGITHFSFFESTPLETIRKVMEVNFFAAVNMTHATLESLIQQRGSIIVLSSAAGFAPLMGRTGYSASKHAMHGFFDSLRSELNDKGVHIMLVSPSFIQTQSQIRDSGRQTEGISRPGSASTTIGKALDVDYVAETIGKAVLKKQRFLIVGKLAKQAYWVHKFFPAAFEKIMSRKVGKEFNQGS